MLMIIADVVVVAPRASIPEFRSRGRWFSILHGYHPPHAPHPPAEVRENEETGRERNASRITAIGPFSPAAACWIASGHLLPRERAEAMPPIRTVRGTPRSCFSRPAVSEGACFVTAASLTSLGRHRGRQPC